MTEGLTSGGGFNTLPGASPFQGSTASASFTYTGALDFNNTLAQNADATGDHNSSFGLSTSNISGYAGSSTVTLDAAAIADYGTGQGFLASSGSASGFQYGSFYTIDLGTLAAGTIQDITHDDGISLFQGGSQIDTTVSRPTSAVTDQVAISEPGDTTLYYSRQNGTPSILEVAVPEPMSVALLGAGLGWPRAGPPPPARLNRCRQAAAAMRAAAV